MSFVRTYDTATASKSPLRHLLSIVNYPRIVWQNRFMMQNFLWRDLMGRFHGSFLGIYWLLVQPVFLFLVYYFVFGLLYGKRDKTTGDLDPTFALYLFSGVIIFYAVNEATSQCCSIITDNGNLVKKVAFPSEVLPMHVGFTSVVIFLVGASVCLVLEMLFGVGHPGWLLLALPLTLLVQLVLILGMGLLLATSHVFIRDTAQLWRIATMAWMFLSPVFWRPSDLNKLPVWTLVMLEHCNPAYALIQAQRLVLGAQGEEFGDFWSQLGLASAWAFGFLLIGYTLFMSQKHKFADLI